ncbi:MAG: amidohydrolase family protein [Chitinophagales bacterium]
MAEYLLYSKRCWVNDALIEATIHVKGTSIYEVYQGKKINTSSMSLEEDVDGSSKIPFHDYGNHIIMPGIIDVHVHINEPGRTEWEGFETATKAAALGGVTTLIEMPLNASPVTTNVEAFKIKQAAAKDKLHVNCGFYGGVIPENDNDIEPLIQAGVFGIKGFLVHSELMNFQTPLRRN